MHVLSVYIQDANGRPPHFFLPNFADSIGPVRVANAEPEELGGGSSHPRKLLATRDVEASWELFALFRHIIMAIVYDCMT